MTAVPATEFPSPAGTCGRHSMRCLPAYPFPLLKSPASVVASNGCRATSRNTFEGRRKKAESRKAFAGAHEVFCILPSTFAPYDSRHRSEEHTSELQSLRHLVCRL